MTYNPRHVYNVALSSCQWHEPVSDLPFISRARLEEHACSVVNPGPLPPNLTQCQVSPFPSFGMYQLLQRSVEIHPIIKWVFADVLHAHFYHFRFRDIMTNTMSSTHWGRVTHICVSNLAIIGSDNGLSPGRRQAITWTNVGILFIGSLGTNFSEMSIEIHAFSFKKIHLKMSSGKWRPFCLGLNVLTSLEWRHMEVMPSKITDDSNVCSTAQAISK